MAEKEYIEREALVEQLKKEECDCEWLWTILDIPAADVAPVRHGHWIDWGGFGSLNNGFIPEYKCSVCNSILHSKRSYCGNCGAKMDGGEGK